MSFLVHYDLVKWIGYRSWVEEPMVLIGTAAYSIVFRQGKGKVKRRRSTSCDFQKGYEIFRDGG